uniref:Uncharacterized protein n=1 Tax=viral metagenome TaxID=1070528 RepID=A0A6C0KZ02_9ZZZZ|tara:strand:- start:2260 stop:2943 length:684 start_codon:yes stop_codon:yes gene_type:complete
MNKGNNEKEISTKKKAPNENSTNPTTTSNGKSTLAVILKEIIKEKIMQEETLSVNIFTSFTFLGVISAWLFSLTKLHDTEHGIYGSASIVIWSYLTALVSLGCILLLKNMTDPNYMFSGTTSVAGFLTIFLMIWVVTLNLKYFKNINMNVVPEQYYDISGWTYFLIIIQSSFVFLTLDSSAPKTDDEHERKNALSIISTFNNIIIFLSSILVLIQQIILEKFSVDVL